MLSPVRLNVFHDDVNSEDGSPLTEIPRSGSVVVEAESRNRARSTFVESVVRLCPHVILEMD
ncbi:hypothetical protein KIN20_007857 [Parelaphostrongylus tenuis]|uniref:Uncharacterized protein n=1 Tax=Parelaphostrongylus tenuis TaxID=148309 RepID=A0AAD5QI66_PARTN|nr:hypothetical protein KIN20_007857 [Parelaphostrongylus tenuis]